MSVITLREDSPGAWEVWIALQDGDPIAQHESFIIGTGDTKEDAVREALHTVTEMLFTLNRLLPPFDESVRQVLERTARDVTEQANRAVDEGEDLLDLGPRDTAGDY